MRIGRRSALAQNLHHEMQVELFQDAVATPVTQIDAVGETGEHASESFKVSPCVQVFESERKHTWVYERDAQCRHNKQGCSICTAHYDVSTGFGCDIIYATNQARVFLAVLIMRDNVHWDD